MRVVTCLLKFPASHNKGLTNSTTASNDFEIMATVYSLFCWPSNNLSMNLLQSTYHSSMRFDIELRPIIVLRYHPPFDWFSIVVNIGDMSCLRGGGVWTNQSNLWEHAYVMFCLFKNNVKLISILCGKLDMHICICYNSWEYFGLISS